MVGVAAKKPVAKRATRAVTKKRPEPLTGFVKDALESILEKARSWSQEGGCGWPGLDAGDKAKLAAALKAVDWGQVL